MIGLADLTAKGCTFSWLCVPIIARVGRQAC